MYRNIATCQCLSGWTGMICEQPNPNANIAPMPLLCSTMMCQNGGRCIQYTSSSAICFCPRGFTGQFCERSDGSIVAPTPAPNLCNSLVCLNGIFILYIKCNNEK